MTTPINPTTVRVREGSDVDIEGVGSIRVLVVKNDGSGAAAYQNVPAGTQLQAVVQSQAGQAVRVNGQPADPARPLQDGDKVSVTPNRVAGA